MNEPIETRARRDDPDTSHEAAASLDISNQCLRVLEAYRDGDWLLDHEAYAIAGFPAGRTSHQRCSDLRQWELITRTSMRKKTPSGKAGYLSVITDAGRRYLKRMGF